MAKVDTYQHPELGQALRFLRARSGLSQARVAEAVSARGGRMTPVWLSRIESAADRGGGPYPSVALLDRVLAVLGSSRAELERLLRERPWARVGEGAEWAEAAAGGSGRRRRSRGGAPRGAAALRAAAAPPGAAAPPAAAAPLGAACAARHRPPRSRRRTSPPRRPNSARVTRASPARQLALLARVRELS